jgi:hypothetical protein
VGMVEQVEFVCARWLFVLFEEVTRPDILF